MSASAHRLVMVGANHKSASLSLRDAMFVDDASAPAVLAQLRAGGLVECLVLSTCDRVETWAISPDPERASRIVGDVFAGRAGVDPAAMATNLYVLTGDEAVRHGFAVTSALDSLVIGEPHVAGQVKAAHRLAREAATLAGELDAYVQAAFAAAKRVRTETAIGEGPVSIAAAAVQVARDLHGDPARLSVLLVGTGEMGELVAESLQAAGVRTMAVTAPRQGRAESLAKSLQCHVLAFDELRERMADHDVVLTCLGGRTPVVTADLAGTALRRRRRRPVLFVDAGIPGDVEIAVNRLEGAFLYDLADLEKVALAGRAGREAAARAARAIVDDEATTFLRGRAARQAVPAIVALRARFDELREAVLAETDNNATEATRLLVNRLLHAPSEAMKDKAAEGAEWQAMEKTLRTLFRLED